MVREACRFRRERKNEVPYETKVTIVFDANGQRIEENLNEHKILGGDARVLQGADFVPVPWNPFHNSPLLVQLQSMQPSLAQNLAGAFLAGANPLSFPWSGAGAGACGQLGQAIAGQGAPFGCPPTSGALGGVLPLSGLQATGQNLPQQLLQQQQQPQNLQGLLQLLLQSQSQAPQNIVWRGCGSHPRGCSAAPRPGIEGNGSSCAPASTKFVCKKQSSSWCCRPQRVPSTPRCKNGGPLCKFPVPYLPPHQKYTGGKNSRLCLDKSQIRQVLGSLPTCRRSRRRVRGLPSFSNCKTRQEECQGQGQGQENPCPPLSCDQLVELQKNLQRLQQLRCALQNQWLPPSPAVAPEGSNHDGESTKGSSEESEFNLAMVRMSLASDSIQSGSSDSPYESRRNSLTEPEPLAVENHVEPSTGLDSSGKSQPFEDFPFETKTLSRTYVTESVLQNGYNNPQEPNVPTAQPTRNPTQPQPQNVQPAYSSSSSGSGPHSGIYSIGTGKSYITDSHLNLLEPNRHLQTEENPASTQSRNSQPQTLQFQDTQRRDSLSQRRDSLSQRRTSNPQALKFEVVNFKDLPPQNTQRRTSRTSEPPNLLEHHALKHPHRPSHDHSDENKIIYAIGPSKSFITDSDLELHLANQESDEPVETTETTTTGADDDGKDNKGVQANCIVFHPVGCTQTEEQAPILCQLNSYHSDLDINCCRILQNLDRCRSRRDGVCDCDSDDMPTKKKLKLEDATGKDGAGKDGVGKDGSGKDAAGNPIKRGTSLTAMEKRGEKGKTPIYNAFIPPGYCYILSSACPTPGNLPAQCGTAQNFNRNNYNGNNNCSCVCGSGSNRGLALPRLPPKPCAQKSRTCCYSCGRCHDTRIEMPLTNPATWCPSAISNTSIQQCPRRTNSSSYCGNSYSGNSCNRCAINSNNNCQRVSPFRKPLPVPPAPPLRNQNQPSTNSQTNVCCRPSELNMNNLESSRMALANCTNQDGNVLIVPSASLMALLKANALNEILEGDGIPPLPPKAPANGYGPMYGSDQLMQNQKPIYDPNQFQLGQNEGNLGFGTLNDKMRPQRQPIPSVQGSVSPQDDLMNRGIFKPIPPNELFVQGQGLLPQGFVGNGFYCQDCAPNMCRGMSPNGQTGPNNSMGMNLNGQNQTPAFIPPQFARQFCWDPNALGPKVTNTSPSSSYNVTPRDGQSPGVKSKNYACPLKRGIMPPPSNCKVVTDRYKLSPSSCRLCPCPCPLRPPSALSKFGNMNPSSSCKNPLRARCKLGRRPRYSAASCSRGPLSCMQTPSPTYCCAPKSETPTPSSLSPCPSLPPQQMGKLKNQEYYLVPMNECSDGLEAMDDPSPLAMADGAEEYIVMPAKLMRQRLCATRRRDNMRM